MNRATEDKKKRIRELREDLLTCPCPFEIAAEFAYENEKLRKQLKGNITQY
jgi:hypothetical protein